jgi:nicotinate-nucleotide pyrophosphorylase (carboxylating)
MEFFESGGNKVSGSLQTLIDLAIAEDLGGGVDITSDATVPEEQLSTAEFVTRKPGVIAGIEVAIEVLRTVGVIDVEAKVLDGQHVLAGSTILVARGNTRRLLLAERTALNFLTHLSGIATETRRWVEAVASTNCGIRDTRKTTPGWRAIEKAAVRAGGGINHRLAL